MTYNSRPIIWGMGLTQLREESGSEVCLNVIYKEVSCNQCLATQKRGREAFLGVHELDFAGIG